MKKLAIFDLDGTLFDTSDVNYYAYLEALKKYNYTIDYDYYVNYCNGRHYKVFLKDIIKQDDIMEKVHDEKKKLYNKYLKYAKINIHLFNIIDKIKDDYYIALVTTASKKNTYEILDNFNKRELFDLILTHEDIKLLKPNPEEFIKAIKHFNAKIEDTIIFEDSPVGISAARESGASVFVVDKF